MQLSISSCLNLLASQMDRGDKVSFSKAYFLNGCPKLSRQLARYYLAIALFQSPLAERSVTVSVLLRSPAVKLVASRAASDTQRHSGSLHFAYRMAAECRPPVPLRPVDDLLVLPGEPSPSRLLWALRFASWSPSLGNPVFRHDETYRASCRCLIHHLHETSLVPIPSARIPRTATSF